MDLLIYSSEIRIVVSVARSKHIQNSLPLGVMNVEFNALLRWTNIHCRCCRHDVMWGDVFELTV